LGCSLFVSLSFVALSFFSIHLWNHITSSTSPVDWLLFSVLAGSIAGSNAKEISPGEIEADTDEQAPYHECFLSLHGVSNNISSGEDDVILVKPLEVDEIPDSKQGE